MILSLNFQYCPKLAVFSADDSSVLLCRRRGEADYDGTFSFIGGKMEHKDETIVDALRREKEEEEVGESFRVNLLPYFSVDTVFTKNDGNRMILPHFYSSYVSGDIELNEEYSEYKWVLCNSLDSFEPKISNISWIAPLLLRAARTATKAELVLL